jgi:hypothetical protein
MNYIRHLNAFFTMVKSDDRLTALHVSLYIALFQYWNLNRFQNPFSVYRDDIMKMSRIGSKNTYHKCIKHLHNTGYIIQHPVNAKYSPAKFSILRLDKKEVKVFSQLNLFNPNNNTERVPELNNTGTNKDTEPVSKEGHLLKPVNSKHLKGKDIFEKNKVLQEAINKMAQVPDLVHGKTPPLANHQLNNKKNYSEPL